MLIFLAAASLAPTQTQPAFDQTEPTCIYHEMGRQEQLKGKQFRLNDAVLPCKSKFGWSDQDVEVALKVTRALVMLRNARAEAEKTGVNLVRVDQLYGTLTNAQVATFGWEGDPKPVPEVFGTVIEPLRSELSQQQFEKAGLTILWSAVAQNSIEGLIKQRIQSR